MHHRRFFVPIRLVMLICWASVVRVCHIIDDMGIFILQLFCISQCTYDLYITLQTEPVFHFPRTSLLFCNYGWFLVVTLQAVPGCHTVMMLQWFLLMLTINSSWLSLSSYIGLLFLYFPLQMVLVCHASKSVVFQKGFRFTANDKLKTFTQRKISDCHYTHNLGLLCNSSTQVDNPTPLLHCTGFCLSRYIYFQLQAQIVPECHTWFISCLTKL